MNETMTDEAIQTHYGRDTVMANVRRRTDGKIIEYKLSDFPVAEKLEQNYFVDICMETEYDDHDCEILENICINNQIYIQMHSFWNR